MANEVVLNALLWDILTENGILESQAEERNADKSKTDIRCTVGDYTVAVEAEHGTTTSKKRSAIEDADNKLARQVCDVAVAVVYPSECNTRDDLLNSELLVNVRTPNYQPEPKFTKWTAVKGTAMADFIRQAPNELGSPEVLAKIADEAINKAAARFTRAQQTSIMNEIGDAAKNTNVKGLMTDLLTAIMFHTKLDTIRYQTAPQWDARQNSRSVFNDVWPPQSVGECLQNGDRVVKNFHAAHNTWLAVDYKHILEWSCAILYALPKSSNSNMAVRIIAEAAIEIQSASGNQHHDLIGITFCQSVETAKNDGSMYTTIPAATMLASLLFHDLAIDWSDFDQVTGLRIVDFACGTGTLLIAAANYILAYERTGRREEVAKCLLEQMLYGFDINNRAIFQTATGIGTLAPSVAFHKMHLYSLILGIDPDDGCPKLGALEMLEGIGQLSFNSRPVTGTRIDSEPAPIETEKFTVAIMNPPFTRGDIRHKHLDKATERQLRDRENHLYTGLPMDQSSNANGFFVLAEKYLDTRRGRLAFVVPTATATNPSALLTRRFLAEKFHIKYLVVSYDPQRIYYSGNTSIGEMLVVMERKRPGNQPPTAVVKLTANPDKASAATACARSILDGQAEQHEWAVVDYIDAATIAEGNWDAVQFVSSELYHIASENLWKNELRNQIIIDPMGRPIRNTQKCDATALYATPALYRHDVEYCNKMEVAPDCFVQPKASQPKLINTLRKANHLKLAERVRLTTVKNMACRTTVPAVGSAWANVTAMPVAGVDSTSVEKAIVMILNSTPGKLGMLLVRSNKLPSYPQFSKDGLERIPMPRLAKLDPAQIIGLTAAYDMLHDQKRLPLPKAHQCPVQLEIDNAVCQHLGFDKTTCETARHLLAQEPMVTGKRYRYCP